MLCPYGGGGMLTWSPEGVRPVEEVRAIIFLGLVVCSSGHESL